MNSFIIKTMIGFLSLGAMTGVGILTKDYIKNDDELTSIASVVKKSSALEEANQEIKQAEKELNEAKEVKEEALEKVKNAEELINKASKEKEEAILEIENAKTTKERQKAQAKIDAATSKIEEAKKTKESAEKEVERVTKVVEQKEQNKQKAEEKAATLKENENKQNQAFSNKKTESNSNVTNNKTQSTTKNDTTTKQNEESEEQGPKYDLNDYPELLDKINEETKKQEKEIEEEAKKKTVEFHFYSTNRNLTIHCTGDYCGDSGHIWFVEVECDLNKCEGFTNSSGNKVSTLLVGRRADITEFNVTPPAAKYGYKFVGWELISSRRLVENEQGKGYLSGKYIATYEKV